MGYGSEAREELAGCSDDSWMKSFAAKMWSQTDTFDAEAVEKTSRRCDAIGVGKDPDSAYKGSNHFTSDSGTDKGGNEQNWFKD
ncbi:MAG: hypothetical protein H7196_00850 [candidate division SR1 bacterium]|nr:hypothetical protein [candidate division SR1 bacterium]